MAFFGQWSLGIGIEQKIWVTKSPPPCLPSLKAREAFKLVYKMFKFNFHIFLLQLFLESLHKAKFKGQTIVCTYQPHLLVFDFFFIFYLGSTYLSTVEGNFWLWYCSDISHEIDLAFLPLPSSFRLIFIVRKRNAPGWARTTNLSVNSRTR